MEVEKFVTEWKRKEWKLMERKIENECDKGHILNSCELKTLNLLVQTYYNCDLCYD